MNGTNYSTASFQRVANLVPKAKIRLLGFALVVLSGTFLLSWITHSLWKQLDRLQKDYTTVKSESLYLGFRLRGSLRALNDQLLQFGISHGPAFRDGFIRDSLDLKNWIAANREPLAQTARLRLLKSVDVSKQLDLLDQIRLNYEGYLTNAETILAETNKTISAGSFESVYKRVRESSDRLLPLCDALVASQRNGFNEFLGGTQVTLANHRLLLMLCSTMILGLAVVLAVLVYRGMIAPLRIGLTEREKIIERQEKLSSLGILASGVAHEVRNPLTAIKFRLFSLHKAVPAIVQQEDAIIISEELHRLDRIVGDFLRFARPSEPKMVKVEAGQILSDVHNLLKPQLKKAGIEFGLERNDPISVRVDVSQIKQVLINLVQNSADSVDQNGTVTMCVQRGQVELNGRTRRVAMLAVADTGKGIPPEVETRLFDPFFTTKTGGTGLGLAISASIVEKHRGLLRYQTELDRGTTFEIILPEAENV